MTLDPQSGKQPRRSPAMQLVSEVNIEGPTARPETPAPAPAPAHRPPPNFRQEYIERAVWKQGLLGALNAMTAVLAQRLIVLVSVSGGIWLTFLALHEPDIFKLGALLIYAIGIVGSSIWLAGR